MRKIFIIIFVLIAFTFFVPGNSEAVTYPDGTLLKAQGHPTVYYIENGMRRPFPNSAVFFTWFASFKDMKVVSKKEVMTFPLAKPMLVKPGTKLVKFQMNPKVYVVNESDVLQHMPNEESAKFLYGDLWWKKIIELPEVYYLFYTVGDALSPNTYEDNEPPKVSVSIEPFGPLIPHYVTVKMSASDNVKVKEVKFMLNGKDSGWSCFTEVIKLDKCVSTLETKEIQTYEAIAVDTSGNTASTGVIEYTD